MGVVVKVDVVIGIVEVCNIHGTGKTILRGTVDEVNGLIKGECFQDDICGGHFMLVPVLEPVRVDFMDTDGDQLVFVRLLGGGVAEFCNAALVVPDVKELHICDASGTCKDGDGVFTVPVGQRPRIIRSLRALFNAAGVKTT